MLNYNILLKHRIPAENRRDGPCAGCEHWKPWASSGGVKGWHACHYILDTGHKRPLDIPECREKRKALAC